MCDSTLYKAPASPAKSSNVTTMLLAAACAGLMASQAQASTFSDVSSDTSNSPGSPTTLPTGTSSVIGSLSFSPSDSIDAFIIPLPSTGSPTLLSINYSLTGPAGTQDSFAFSATTGGVLATVPNLASGSLSLSIPAGLSLKVVGTLGEFGPLAYTLDITNVTPVPLPNPAALTAVGLAGLGALGLLGKKAKSRG